MCYHFDSTNIANAVAIIVAFSAAAVTLISNAYTRRHEKKLAILKVILEAGYKEYEFRTKEIYDRAKAEGKEPTDVLSFTEYIIFYREMSEVFAKENVTEGDIRKALEGNKKLIDTYYRERKNYPPNRKGE